MSHTERDPSDPREPRRASAPVELTEAELRVVAGGLNPQPLPPFVEPKLRW
jgi:hypothetical protein